MAIPDNVNRGMLFSEAIDYYLQSFRYLQKKPSTQNNEAFKAETLKKYLGNYAVENISPRVVREFRDKRLQCKGRGDKDLSADTVRLESSLISIIFRSLRRDLDLDIQNPVNDVDIPKGKV